MKLTPMTCPACGAVLHLDPESGMAHCSHCGTLYVLDDERKRVSIEDGYDFGYDFERGRMKAQGEDGSRPKPTDAKGANGGGRSQDKGQRTSVAADSAVPRTPLTKGGPRRHGCLWVAILVLFCALCSTGNNGSGTGSTTSTHVTPKTSSKPSVSASIGIAKQGSVVDAKEADGDSSKSSSTESAAATSTESPAPKPTGVAQEEVRRRYDEASELLEQDLAQHGDNEAFEAYDTAVEGLWTLSQDSVTPEADLTSAEHAIDEARKAYLSVAEQLEHEAARQQAEREREERERAEKEEAERQRVADIEASYVDPEVLLVLDGTLAHRSKALDLLDSDSRKYYPWDTGAEEYYDAFFDWITLHEHYEYTKEYSDGPYPVRPGDRFYVSDQEMSDATAHLRDLRRNMVIAYAIEHPEG